MERKEITFSPMKGIKNHCTLAQVWDHEGNSLAVVDSRYGSKKSTEYASAICEALNVANQTGMTPATLQAKLEKARQLIKEASDWFSEEASIKMRNGANRDVVDNYDNKASKLNSFLKESL